MSDVVIVGYVRTPIGKFGGALKDVHPAHLAAYVIRKALERAGAEPKVVDEVIMGHVLQGGFGQNIARQASLLAGLPVETSAYTVNRVCSSGMQAIIEGVREVKLGDAEVVVAGGVESMSMAPFVLPSSIRWGVKMLFGARRMEVIDLMYFDGLTDPTSGKVMGEEADMVARERRAPREELDWIAYESHMRATRATEGKLFAEMEPLLGEELGGVKVTLEKDEGIRPDTSLEKLARLSPVFTKEGPHTAGTSSQISDGAAAVVLTTLEKAKELGLRPIARILGYSWAMVEPWRFVEAPVKAVRRLLEKLKVEEVDYFENNEAFAISSYIFTRDLGVPYDRLNPFGGAIALGHPIGASGARIITTLISVLKHYGGRRGIASLCHGTGGATALAIELV